VKKDYIITFGYNHKHPTTGESLGQRFFRIPHSDEFRARLRALRLFGKQWSHIYDSEDAAGVRKYGLKELPRSEVPNRV
jgi:hypothetical protein